MTWMSTSLNGVRRVAVSSGITLAFRELGDRREPTVVLLHAWGESSLSFDRLTASLPATMNTIAVDLRGHGDSDKPTEGYDLVSLARDVGAFLDALGVASAVLVGSSSGGYVAQECAVLSPDRVSGLLLAGAPSSLSGRPPFADEIDALVDPIEPAWAQDFVDWFAVENEVPDGYRADRVRDALSIPADVWRLSLAGLTDSVPPLQSGRITAPTLAIWGDRDALISPADQADLVAVIPGARRVMYEGVGHLVLWEQPEQLARDLTAFVRDLDRWRAAPESS